MNKILLLVLISISALCFSQDNIKLSYASQYDDFIEIDIEMNKPTSKFNLIDFDTVTVTDNKKQVWKENREYPLNYNYNNGENKVKRYYIPDHTFKTVDIKGVMKYFTPSKANGSYFNLGSLGDILRNSNLIDKKITDKNPELYFSIVDSTVINKIFPDFKYKINEDEDYKKIDFKSYDFIYSYRYNKKQKIMYFINDDGDPGYDNLSIRNKKTGITYKFVKLKKGITPYEVNQVRIELMIENEKSIRKIPFELKDIIVEKK